MNVKLTITVPIEEVPDKVSSILLETANNLQSFCDNLKCISNDIKQNNDTLNCISKIDIIRKKLFAVDSSLEDCYSILKGYINYEYKLKDEIKEGNENVTSDQRSGS